MDSVEDEMELEDGEINDLEDGEIEDGEHYDGKSTMESHKRHERESGDSTEVRSSVHPEKLKRLPVRDRPPTTWRQRSDFGDVDRERGWNRGRNVARGRSDASYSRNRGFHPRAGMPVLPRRHSLSPPGYGGYVDLKNRSPPPPGPPYSGYPSQRHRSPPPFPQYIDNIDHPPPRHRSPQPCPFVSEREEHLPVRHHLSVRPFFGDNQGRPAGNVLVNPRGISNSDMPKEKQGEDDFELLLERHKLIQQQLETLEKQEKAALAADHIIDETFIDIPLDDTINQSATTNRVNAPANEDKLIFEDTSDKSLITDNSRNDNINELSKEIDTVKTEDEEISSRTFSPFKIKPLYTSVPSLSERSKHDLELRKTKGEPTTNLNTTENNSSVTDSVTPASTNQKSIAPQAVVVDPVLPLGSRLISVVGPELNSKRSKRRRRQRRRKKSVQEQLASNTRTIPATRTVLVDPHAELENKLFDLALSSDFQEDPVLVHSEGPNIRGDIQDRQKKRKEQLKKWQESHSKQQQNSNNNNRIAGGQKKKKKKNELRGRGLSRRESIGNRKLLLDVDEYEFDDYLEMPMDVESDSADGPVLPLIEDTTDKPPLPPLPSDFENQFAHVRAYQDPNMPVVFGTAPFPPQVIVSGYGGHYDVEQEPYGMWSSGFDEGIADTDEGAEIQTRLKFASKDDEDGDDDDDEDALRALLLKSMANKRAAKLAAETQPSPNSSAPASPGVDSFKPPSGKSSTSTANSSARSYPVRKAMVVPPKHEPVVIQLGQDSDDSEDDQDHPLASAAKGASSLGGGLFGGLELMIKEARKSADVSKGRSESPGVNGPSGTPPRLEPKTPEALEHMPDYKKAEYKRLKEKLAQYEKKKRQPLTAVNQDKESSDVSTVNNTLPPSLVKLAGHVKECETKLAKQRKMLDQDQVLLSTVNSNVTEKKAVLETQEGKVRQLQQQLESARKLVLRSRLLVNKLNEQGKTIKERVTKKLLIMSDVEEELLRAKSFVSAWKRQPMAMLGVQSLDNDQKMVESENKSNSQEGTTGENKTGRWNGAGLVQKISDALVQKLQQLTEASKKEVQGDGGTKRNVQAAANLSGDELAVKKVKTESSSLLTRTPSPVGTPNRSAPNTPRKSAVAERIAQEKARLKKIEHELAEKLKLYNTQMELDTTPQECLVSETSAPMEDTNQEPVKEEETPLDTEGADSKQSGMTTTVSEDERTSKMAVGFTKPVDRREQIGAAEGRRDNGPDGGFFVSEQQLEYVKKLQNEKERRHTASELSPLKLPVPVHESAAQCIWLTSSGPLKTLVPPGTAEPGTGPAEIDATIVKTAPGNEAEIACDDQSPFPLENYRSLLLYFKSYRLSPYFRTQSNLSLSSASYATKLDPRCQVCSYDLQGVCNDEECAFQHRKDCEMSKEEILQDIAAYDAVTVKKNQTDRDFMHKRAVKLAQSFHNQYKEKMSVDEICLLLVNRVRRSRKITGPYSIAGDPRVWRPCQGKRKAIEMKQETVVDRGKGIIFPRDESVIGSEKANRNTANKKSRLPCDGDESQEVRYFSETYSSIDRIEATLNESPHDVELWIKLARLKLRQKSDKEEISGEVQERNQRQALSTLSRGLEANRDAQGLWLYYLQLFTAQGTADDAKELYEQALVFAPAYLIWWQYIEFQVSYCGRKDVCLRLLDHLVHNPQENVEVHSHHILETLLYVVQLELFTSHYKKALGCLQAALGRLKGTSSNTRIPDLTSHLVPNDHCLLWIAYIHVFEFHRVPLQWYEPSCGKPSRMVSKEHFVFPWQPSKGSRAPYEKLLTLFHDALRACTNHNLPRDESVSISMPLYKNLVALERAHNRLDSAKGICGRLLKDNSSNVELWQCRAALDQVQGCMEGAKKAYDEGLSKCRGHAALVYSAARFYLEKGESCRSLQLLVYCVYSKFATSPQSDGNESSLTEVSSSVDCHDAVLLYCKLLSQPLPYEYRCPPLLEGVSMESLKEQQVFLWLNYCLLLELSSDDSSTESVRVEGMFETAVHSALDKKNIQTLWLEYLFYKRSVVLASNMEADEVKAMEDLVNRCLVSSPTSCLVPYTTTSHWQDYSFHNKVVNLYLSCVPQSLWSAAMHKFLKWFPSNTNLALQAVSIELQRNCIKEARKLYEQATDKLPFAATLWKDVILAHVQLQFLMFEIARGDSKQRVNGIVERCKQLGVDIEQFCRTLQGK